LQNEILAGQVKGHGKRIDSLEHRVSVLDWLMRYMALFIGLISAFAMLFVRVSEVSPFITEANLFLLLIVTFTAGLVFGWILMTTARRLYKDANLIQSEDMPESSP
jgi:hypothetical protein